MKIVMTLCVEWDVNNLEEYEASTIEEAAKNQKEWLEEGSVWLGDFVEDMKIISVEGVK